MFDLDGDGDTAEPLSLDLNDRVRVVDGDNDSAATVDMGALESSANFCDEPVFDWNGNNIDDACDIEMGTSLDCDGNGVPDECSPDCDGDGTIDACDDDIDGDGVLNDVDVCDFTPLGATIQSDGTLSADLDGDCDVDINDFAILRVS